MLTSGTLRKMKIDIELLEKILSPEVKVLVSLFKRNNYEIRLAGGPVRNLLMGKIPADLDFATTATPDQMKSMFEAENIRMINTKGESHGTITARINDKENFEVTTLRTDLITDGRHAEVVFTTDWELDSARRDLTVNSMFLDLNGEVYDYFNGAEDLKNRRVRFVGEPADCIKEDYFRILRYFRFYGRLSLKSDDHEEATLEAIRQNMDGLQRISGERIWMELKKILTGNYSKELIIRMLELGMGQYIGLPSEADLDEFKTVCERAEKLDVPFHSITRLTGLLRTDKEGVALNASLKLSAFERDLCLFIIHHRKSTVLENSIRPFQQLAVFSKSKILDVRQWTEEVLKYAGSIPLLGKFQQWQMPKFPVSGSLLAKKKVPLGRVMTRVLNELKEIWIDSDFTASSDELLMHLPQILDVLPQYVKLTATKMSRNYPEPVLLDKELIPIERELLEEPFNYCPEDFPPLSSDTELEQVYYPPKPTIMGTAASISSESQAEHISPNSSSDLRLLERTEFRTNDNTNQLKTNTTARISLCPCGIRSKDHSESGIFCEKCETWFHSSCVSMTDTDISAWSLRENPWFCNRCSIETQSQSEVTSPNLITCTACFKSFKPRGYKQHWTKSHPGLTFEPVVFPTTPKVHSQNPHPDELVAKLSNYKRDIRILKRIPKAARIFGATKLKEAIDRCIDLNDSDSWTNLLTFSYAAFRVPEKSNKSLSRLVKSNILSLEIPEPCPRNFSITSFPRRIESKVSDGDIRGAIKLLASSDSLAAVDFETFSKLEQKHPAPSRLLTLPEPPDEESYCLISDMEDVRAAIMSFPSGSAGGPDGLRPQHLKDLISVSNGEAGLRLLQSITNLCNMMLSGKVCSEVCKILYGASLCAITKKNGDVRPIAIGTTFRRLTAKICCKSVGDSVGFKLRPYQLGVNTRGGCEAAVHAARTFIKDNRDSDFVLLKVDCRNAFNSVERDSMFTAVKDWTPSIYDFLWQCYSTPSLLFFGQDTILSQVGAQQGDPCGPLIFSITIHSIVESLRSNLNSWYLDDGLLAGPPETVLQDFETIITKFSELGLKINPEKCELYFLSAANDSVVEAFSHLSPGIQVIEDELELLGSPLTFHGFEAVFKKKEEEVCRLLERLKLLNFHVAYFLLKNCLAIPKFTYLLRSTPCWLHSGTLERLDSEIKSTLEWILNNQLSEQQRTISSFPTRLGGLGVRKIEDIALPAFLGSVHSINSLVNNVLKFTSDNVFISDYAEAKLEWYSINSSEPELKTSQKEWDNINLKRIIENLNLTNPKDKARFLAASTPEASLWLSTLPSRSLGTLLDNNCFRISCAIRIGCSICKPHTCICGEIVDGNGTHGLSCSKSAGRHSRHQEINNLICRALHSAKIPSVLEPAGLNREDGKRVDGMTLVPWEKGQLLLWDSTCSDSFAPSYLNNTSQTAGWAAEKAAHNKRNKYKDIIDQNYLFVPFAVETLGPWCSEAIKFINSLGDLLNAVSGESNSKLYLKQRISLAIQRGNAASIMGTFNNQCSMDEIFYLL